MLPDSLNMFNNIDIKWFYSQEIQPGFRLDTALHMSLAFAWE